MDLEAYFSGLLDAKSPDLELDRQAWDRRADEVGRFSIDANDAALQTVLRHHRLAGERVLEISFGGGRHLAEFARRGARVSGVEISAGMLGHARARLQAEGLEAQLETLVHAPWETLELAAHGWEAAFDLVFLNMSPAISSAAMLRKALEATRAGLYLGSHAHREDSLLGELQDAFGMPRRRPGSRSAGDAYAIFNLLWQWGYFPGLAFEERSRSSAHAPDNILQRYASWLWRDGADEADLQRLRAALERRAVDGQVHSGSRSIIAHLYVDTRVRRR